MKDPTNYEARANIMWCATQVRDYLSVVIIKGVEQVDCAGSPRRLGNSQNWL